MPEDIKGNEYITQIERNMHNIEQVLGKTKEDAINPVVEFFTKTIPHLIAQLTSTSKRIDALERKLKNMTSISQKANSAIVGEESDVQGRYQVQNSSLKEYLKATDPRSEINVLVESLQALKEAYQHSEKNPVPPRAVIHQMLNDVVDLINRYQVDEIEGIISKVDLEHAKDFITRQIVNLKKLGVNKDFIIRAEGSLNHFATMKEINELANAIENYQVFEAKINEKRKLLEEKDIPEALKRKIQDQMERSIKATIEDLTFDNDSEKIESCLSALEYLTSERRINGYLLKKDFSDLLRAIDPELMTVRGEHVAKLLFPSQEEEWPDQFFEMAFSTVPGEMVKLPIVKEYVSYLNEKGCDSELKKELITKIVYVEIRNIYKLISQFNEKPTVELFSKIKSEWNRLQDIQSIVSQLTKENLLRKLANQINPEVNLKLTGEAIPQLSRDQISALELVRRYEDKLSTIDDSKIIKSQVMKVVKEEIFSVYNEFYLAGQSGVSGRKLQNLIAKTSNILNVDDYIFKCLEDFSKKKIA